jgi:hypothetical protein
LSAVGSSGRCSAAGLHGPCHSPSPQMPLAGRRALSIRLEAFRQSRARRAGGATSASVGSGKGLVRMVLADPAFVFAEQAHLRERLSTRRSTGLVQNIGDCGEDYESWPEITKKMIGAGCPGSRSRRIRGQRIGRERHELALPAHLIEPSTLDRVAFVEQEVPLISSMWMRPSCACSTVLAISMMQRAAFSESPKGRLLASFVPG